MAPAPRFRWPTSVLPIWPVGQADGAPAGGQLRVRVARPQLVETGVLASDTALPGPAGARPQPSRTISATPPGPGRSAIASPAAATIAANDAGVEAGAADERAVDVGQREQLGGVVGLHAAAVEDARALGLLARRGRRRARG